MATLKVLFAIALVGHFASALTELTALTQDVGTGPALVREPRGHRRRLCRKYGICGNQGFGGFQQGSGGYQQGYQGYQGYPPAINIGISQSQSSASAGGGGYSSGYYPNNHQYNGFPNQGYHGGYPNQGFGGRPGFSNGQGGYNNQFNGNYYGPGAGNGFGFPGPFQGGYYDEAQNNDGPAHDDGHNELSEQEQNDQALFGDHNEAHGPQDPQDLQSPQGPHGISHDYVHSGSYAFAGRNNN